MKKKSKFLSTAAAAALTAAGLLVAPLAPASAAPGQSQSLAWGTTLNVASRATANEGHPNAVDSAAVIAPLRPFGPSPASASATAQALCEGCSAQAATLQVLLSAQDSTIRANNVATAYTTGSAASSAAVSIQIVAATGSHLIAANNRAVAINEYCTGCTATSVAIQFILVGGQISDLSAAARSLVLQIENELSITLADTATQPPGVRKAKAQSSANSAAQRARDVIAADTGAAVQTKVELDTAG